VTQKDFDLPTLEGCEIVLRESITEADGTVIYARDFGIGYFIKVEPRPTTIVRDDVDCIRRLAT